MATSVLANLEVQQLFQKQPFPEKPMLLMGRNPLRSGVELGKPSLAYP